MGREYRRERQEYRELCEKKKGEENESLERKAMEARRKNEVWEIVNKERKKRKMVKEGIEMKEWREHFMRLLEGWRIG